MYSDILAPATGKHIFVEKAIVEILKFSKHRYLDLSKNFRIYETTLYSVLRRISERKLDFLSFQEENHLRRFHPSQVNHKNHVINVTTNITPPPKKEKLCNVDSVKLSAHKNSRDQKAKQNFIRISRRLLRYLHELKVSENPTGALKALREIADPQSSRGAYHRAKILKPYYNRSTERRLILIASDLLKQLIAASSENLGGAA